jgi:hypothetical protein
MGIQELLLHFHPTFAVVILPFAGLLALLALPYLTYNDDTSGIWFASRRGRQLAIRAVGLALVVTPILVMLDEWVVDLPGWLPWLPSFISNGVVPMAILVIALWAGARRLRHRAGATRYETMQTVFVFVSTAFVVLTAPSARNVQRAACRVQRAGRRANRGGMARSARRCGPAAEEWFVAGTAVRRGPIRPDERTPR